MTKEINGLEDIKNTKDRQLVHLLQNLVQIPSWPIRDDKSGSLVQNENDVVDFLETWINENTTLQTVRQSLDEGRFNLIASKGNPDLVFLAHTDTVAPSVGAPYDQLASEIHDGKIWGLGTTDMKSGIATMLQAISLTPETDNLWAIFYADEERDFLGMKALVKDYSELRPELIVSSDGSDLKLGHGCRGLMEIKFRLRGQTGHAAKGNGLNAIDGVIKTLTEVRKYLAKYKHPIMGPTSMNLSYLLGGTELSDGKSFDEKGELVEVEKQGNIIPDLAEFILDIRPSSPDLTVEKIVEFMKEVATEDGYKFEVNGVRHNLGAWYTDINQIEAFAEVASEVTGKEVQFDDPGRSGYIDLQMIWEAIGRPPALMFGGGVGNTAHKPDEHIEIGNLIKERDFFKKVLEKH